MEAYAAVAKPQRKSFGRTSVVMVELLSAFSIPGK